MPMRKLRVLRNIFYYCDILKINRRMDHNGEIFNPRKNSIINFICKNKHSAIMISIRPTDSVVLKAHLK